MNHYHRDKIGNLVESIVEKDKKTGLYYRKDTSDRKMIKDCMNNYTELDIKSEDKVLDLGANIGGFSYYASQFTQNILAVEADKYNCNMIKENTNVELIEKAVVPNDYLGDYVEFLINKRSGSSACSGRALFGRAKKTKRHIFDVVPVIRFSELVDYFQPTILKIDIEGGEYGIIDREIPYSIRQIGGELHNHPDMFQVMENLKDKWEVRFEQVENIFGNPSLINFVVYR